MKRNSGNNFLYMLRKTLISLLLISTISVNAQQSENENRQVTYTTPNALTSTKMESRDDALPLLKSTEFHLKIKQLAGQLSEQDIAAENMFNRIALLSALDRHSDLLTTLQSNSNAINYSHYRLHSETTLALKSSTAAEFRQLLQQDFAHELTQLKDQQLTKLSTALGWSVEQAQDYIFNIFKRYNSLETLDKGQLINLIVNTHLHRVLERVIPTTKEQLNKELNMRFEIEPDRLITTANGVQLSATIVRKKQPGQSSKKLPTAMQFTIYADERSHIKTATNAAAHGYVGVVVNARGKRSSNNQIIPWEKDGEDATAAIDWISKQSWSNGKVLMYGGSYNGFTQWAAAKHMHPALTAIAPYAAASLITGLPYENNIALTLNYQWAFYVTNNKTTDFSVYASWKESNDLLTKLFESGKAIADIDKIDGKPNPWFQKWLQHPQFDSYYQKMVPYQQDYANINIPVLTVTGYFDGGQLSAVDYLKRHYKYNKNANHTLLIGPYDHRTAQGTVDLNYSNYQLDPAALEKDTEEVVFQWFDHLLYNKPKPEILKDKVNYQLMGSNQWRHSPSLEQLNQLNKTYYLGSKANEESQYSLLTKQEDAISYVEMTVDMTNRESQHNSAPWPVIQDKLDEANGFIYMTAPFKQAQELAGAITGQLSIAVNKKDVDIGYNFYEIDENGKAFHLNNYRSRASYAKSMDQRQLLTPNQKTDIPIVNARMTAKLINQGSRLAVVLNINKNRDAQVNMGSGKPVNYETIEDAAEPLKIKWFNDSQINLPLKPWNPSNQAD